MEAKESKTVFISVEPSAITPVWFSRSIEGVRSAAAKQKKAVRLLDSLELIDELTERPVAVILISTNNSWTHDAIDFCRSRDIRPILIGSIPSRFGEDVSGTIYSTKSSIDELLYYYKCCDRKRVALLGINENGSNDAMKVEAFLNASRALGIPASADDIYSNSKESRNPNERFFDNIACYNAVICSNDYTAAYVLEFARNHGISVPGDLYVSGLGDSLLCRYTTPSLTSATRSYLKTGEQAFSIWKQLNTNPDIFAVTVTVQCEIKPRESTACSPLPDHHSFSSSDEKKSLLPPGTVKQNSDSIRCLANCISQCDSLDMEIIRKILDGVSTENLAEQLFISTGTARYRLKKIYTSANTSSRHEFVTLFSRHISYAQMFEDIHGYSDGSFSFDGSDNP